MKADFVMFKLEREHYKLLSLLEAIERSVIPEKELPEFVAELQKLADSETDYGFGRSIKATIETLPSVV